MFLSTIKAEALRLRDTVVHLIPQSEGSNDKDKYVLRPLDVVLFEGASSDPVSAFIKSVTLHGVVPKLRSPFHRLWTHSGILADNTVLPLPCLQDGKMYIYESVFSGEIYPVYQYSCVLPVDQAIAEHSYHLGPQIRDFAAVVAEGDTTVGVAPLTDDFRQLVVEQLKHNPNLLLDIHKEFQGYTFPIPNILPAVAAAEEVLYNELQSFKRAASSMFPHASANKKPEIFCSELVATIFKRLGLPSFINTNPDQVTPLSLEVCPEFGGNIFYAKEFKTLYLNENAVSTVPLTAPALRSLSYEPLQEHWIQMGPDGGLPESPYQSGHLSDGTALYLARVKIGDAYHIGYISQTSAFPTVTYLGRPVEIHFGHQVLQTGTNLTWVAASQGDLPLRAIRCGVDLEGNFLYAARALFRDHAVEAELLESSVSGDGGVCLLGAVEPDWRAARFAHDGQEVKVASYEVLCHDSFF
ncbi:hypothetical protein CcCBS67573_g01294 [Chytriomyces confervae]|uniref:Uncharacterized protein n=1 Tax=Chytriomyces confervae TaxID=246404 RepID=A0A507FP98_9FUNG|nr:hypothetical protein CcCBS67573_g01294 [Chytriomyces confervae]